MKKKSLIILVVFFAVLAFAGYRIVHYYLNYADINQQISEMQTIYYDNAETVGDVLIILHNDFSGELEKTDPLEEEDDQTLIQAEKEGATYQSEAEETEICAESAVKKSSAEYLIPSERFLRLKKINRDIIGWLTIEDVLDTAIVQKDNKYYLTHDYKGKRNVNGAVFLDQNCRLEKDSGIFIVYGHNMKTGAMMGFIHSYFTTDYWHRHPIMTFDTQYKEGKFVIYAVCRMPVSILEYAISHLQDPGSRETLIQHIDYYSIYNRSIRVSEEDDLVFLSTCTEEDSQRQVLVGRRIQEGESEKRLREAISTCKKKNTR